jgi:hypothetical protein
MEWAADGRKGRAKKKRPGTGSEGLALESCEAVSRKESTPFPTAEERDVKGPKPLDIPAGEAAIKRPFARLWQKARREAATVCKSAKLADLN